jgi:preprotein translocase subunit SecG
MYILVVLIHVIVCMFLIIVILLQSGKAADLAGAFGGMSQTAFGPRGSATLLSKATTISAIVFMCTSLGLSIMATRNAGAGATVLDRKTPAKQSTPAPIPTPAPAGKPQQAPVTPKK